ASADRPGLHILGLNCFVSVAGGRPSNAVTLNWDPGRVPNPPRWDSGGGAASAPTREGSAALRFFSAGGERLGDAEASFATAGPQRSVVTMARHSLVVSVEECP